MPTDLPRFHKQKRQVKKWSYAYIIYVISMVVLGLCAFILILREGKVSPPSLSKAKALLHGRKVLIAANYFNNMQILEAHTEEMARFLGILKEAGAQPFVSVYENGSEDDTPIYLRNWGHRLNKMGISQRINIDSAPAWHAAYEEHIRTSPNKYESKTMFRIRFMAEVRNKALQPMQEQDFDDVIFFNDILFDASDILRLVLTDDMRYDVVCAMDFNRVTLYDTWVARDVNGERMSSFYPFSADEESIRMIQSGNPFPVSSCWNGVVSMKAKPFKSIRFRTWNRDEPRMISRRMPQQNAVYNDDCPASECGLIFEDLAKIGHTNVFMNPTVHVTYRHEDRILHNLFGGALNWFMWWFMTIRPHGRIPPSVRIAECGAERVLTISTFSYFVPLVVIGIVVALRWAKSSKRSIPYSKESIFE